VSSEEFSDAGEGMYRYEGTIESLVTKMTKNLGENIENALNIDMALYALKKY
jgi:hypothetical protein